ncbi:2332_t:CDS:2, partial [Scutellospora calospora]
SVGDDKSVHPFWNGCIQTLSRKLWLLRQLYLNNTKSNSWFSIKTFNQMISSQNIYYTSSEPLQLIENERLKTYKIRIYPNHQEKQILLKWIGQKYAQCDTTSSDNGTNNYVQDKLCKV